MEGTLSPICAALMIVSIAPVGLADDVSEQSFTYVGGGDVDGPVNPALCWNVGEHGQLVGEPIDLAVGGRCFIEIDSSELVVVVDDAEQGPMGFVYEAEDADGAYCTEEPGSGQSGVPFSLPADCVVVSIWTLAGATTGTITVTS